MPVHFGENLLAWIENNAPRTFGRLNLLFLMEGHLERMILILLRQQEDADFNHLYHQNLQLIDLCQNHQLQIFRQMMDLYQQDVLILSGLRRYNGTHSRME